MTAKSKKGFSFQSKKTKEIELISIDEVEFSLIVDASHLFDISHKVASLDKKLKTISGEDFETLIQFKEAAIDFAYSLFDELNDNQMSLIKELSLLNLMDLLTQIAQVAYSRSK